MSKYLMFRELADGTERIVGVTPDTTMAPKAIADSWVASRPEINDKVRLYFADINSVTVVDADPRLTRQVTTSQLTPTQAVANIPTIPIS